MSLMSTQHSSHQFAAATPAQSRGLTSDDHELVIRQKPQHAKVFIGKEKDRKPIDPPPIVQLRVNEEKDPGRSFLQSPYYFVSCSLVDDGTGNRPESERDEVKNALAGSLVSSLHRLKDSDNNDGGFFVFGDLSVKVEGMFRLQFTLYEVRGTMVEYIRTTTSDIFTVHAAKNFPGMSESTFLTRSFSDQGVRLRLRKEPRFRLQKEGPASDDYRPRHYNTKRGDVRIDSSQAESQPQRLYAQTPDTFSGSSQQQSPTEFQGFAQHPTQLQMPARLQGAHQAIGSYESSRKRGYSDTSYSDSHSSYPDDQFPKRNRQDLDSSLQNYAQNYSLQGSQNPQRQFTEPSSMAQYGFSQVAPQFQSGSYGGSSQSISVREQGFTPRRLEGQGSILSAPFDTPSLRSQYQRSSTGVPSYTQQPAYNAAQQQQFPQQYPVSVPSHRGIPPAMYQSYSEQEQQQVSRPTAVSIPSEMPPPNFSRGLSGSLQGSINYLPPPATDELRYGGTWQQDYRRDDNPARQ